MPHAIVMPALSAGMEDGTIARWLKDVGDAVAVGEVIAEIETDKATMEMEAEQAGTIGRIVAGDGVTVAVNAPIAVLLLEGESAESLSEPSQGSAPATPAGPPAAAPPSQEIEPKDPASRRSFASPLARRLAREKGIALESVAGSGSGGRIVRLDIEAAATAPTRTSASAPSATAVPAPVPAPATAPAPAASPAPVSHVPPADQPYTEIPLTNVRKVIARRLTEAKTTIPHFYLEVDCQIDALLELREMLNAQSDGQYKLSVNDFVIKAAALALRQVPEANATWTSDAILQYENVDISVAVATDGGLITPIVRQADQKGLSSISAEVKALAARAREGQLKPAEFQGGSFSVSNLGMYGVRAFSAIINPPQSCILAVGAAESRPVVREGVCVPAMMMSCTLSVDHRAVDGAVGAQYMAVLKALIEQPLRLML